MSKTSVKQAISEFLLSCKVEGKSYGTIECFYVIVGFYLERAAQKKKP